jgi:hypothetical protein
MTAITNPVATATTTARPPATAGKGWARAGALAGLAATVAFLVSSGIAPQDEALFADNALLAEKIIDQDAIVWMFQVLTVVAAGGIAVFAAGLRRKLAAQAPAESLLPAVAAAGLASVAAMLLVGGGISTELFWHLAQDYGKSDPDTIVANLAIFDTIAWVWAGLGLTTGSVAVAALRHGSLPRWLGWVSAVATVLIALTQLVPLQYMAAFVGAPWLLVAGLGLARQERLA